MLVSANYRKQPKQTDSETYLAPRTRTNGDEHEDKFRFSQRRICVNYTRKFHTRRCGKTARYHLQVRNRKKAGIQIRALWSCEPAAVLGKPAILINYNFNSSFQQQQHPSVAAKLFLSLWLAKVHQARLTRSSVAQRLRAPFAPSPARTTNNRGFLTQRA